MPVYAQEQVTFRLEPGDPHFLGWTDPYECALSEHSDYWESNLRPGCGPAPPPPPAVAAPNDYLPAVYFQVPEAEDSTVLMTFNWSTTGYENSGLSLYDIDGKKTIWSDSRYIPGKETATITLPKGHTHFYFYFEDSPSADTTVRLWKTVTLTVIPIPTVRIEIEQVAGYIVATAGVLAAAYVLGRFLRWI